MIIDRAAQARPAVACNLEERLIAGQIDLRLGITQVPAARVFRAMLPEAGITPLCPTIEPALLYALTLTRRTSDDSATTDQR